MMLHHTGTRNQARFLDRAGTNMLQYDPPLDDQPQSREADPSAVIEE